MIYYNDIRATGQQPACDETPLAFSAMQQASPDVCAVFYT